MKNIAIQSLVFVLLSTCIALAQAKRIDVGRAKGKPIPVSFIRLLAAPEKFDGKLVSFTAYLGDNGSPDFDVRLYLSSEDRSVRRNDQSVELRMDTLSFPYLARKELDGQLVYIQGVIELVNQLEGDVRIAVKPNYISGAASEKK